MNNSKSSDVILNNLLEIFMASRYWVEFIKFYANVFRGEELNPWSLSRTEHYGENFLLIKKREEGFKLAILINWLDDKGIYVLTKMTFDNNCIKWHCIIKEIEDTKETVQYTPSFLSRNEAVVASLEKAIRINLLKLEN